MSNRMDFSLRPLAQDDLRSVFEWRNSDRVRTKMFESQVIPWKNHLKWFHSLQGNPHQQCMMFEYNGRTIGVVTVKLVDKEADTWIWGCYLGPMRAVPKAGTIMGFCALEFFFESMKVARVIGEAVAANSHSLEFNARLGFKTEKAFVKRNSLLVDVPAILLTYTVAEWARYKPELVSFCFDE